MNVACKQQDLLKRFWCGSAGLTLVELMVVVALIAIVLSVAMPATTGYLRQRGVREAAEQLAMDLQKSKLLAITRNANCSIAIDAANNRYTISLSNEIVDLARYRGGVTFTNDPIATSAIITFTPQGLCNPPGDILLTNTEGSATFRLRTSMAGGVSQMIRTSTGWH